MKFEFRHFLKNRYMAARMLLDFLNFVIFLFDKMKMFYFRRCSIKIPGCKEKVSKKEHFLFVGLYYVDCKKLLIFSNFFTGCKESFEKRRFVFVGLYLGFFLRAKSKNKKNRATFEQACTDFSKSGGECCLR